MCVNLVHDVCMFNSRACIQTMVQSPLLSAPAYSRQESLLSRRPCTSRAHLQPGAPENRWVVVSGTVHCRRQACICHRGTCRQLRLMHIVAVLAYYFGCWHDNASHGSCCQCELTLCLCEHLAHQLLCGGREGLPPLLTLWLSASHCSILLLVEPAEASRRRSRNAVLTMMRAMSMATPALV